METPHTGRAAITEFYNGIEITVSAKRPANFILQSAGITAFVVIIIYFVVPAKQLLAGQKMDGFLIFIYCSWGAGLLLSLYKWWWAFTGKELITVNDGVLTIEKKGTLYKTKSYDLNEAKDFRAVEEEPISGERDLSKTAYTWGVAKQGTVKFDYGTETIQFGDLLSQVEGEHILQRLRDKRLIK